jgi:hypothetical protein
MLHPVFIKKNAVNARNQKNVVTASDKQRRYAAAARDYGKTLGDITNELRMWQLYVELVAPKR